MCEKACWAGQAGEVPATEGQIQISVEPKRKLQCVLQVLDLGSGAQWEWKNSLGTSQTV